MSGRILVIKLAALGDFVQATGPMRRIRAAHPQAHITLLTTPPYAGLGRATGLFDAVDERGRPHGVMAQLALLRRLRRARFERVYDLQTSDRSSALRLAFLPRAPQWSGIAVGASHPHDNPQRDRMHTLERQADQLRAAGVWPDAPTAPGAAPPPDLGFIAADAGAPARFGLAPPFALLVPGASPQRPGKRWPVQGFADLAQRLASTGVVSAIVGGSAEAALGGELARAGAVDLTGRTSFTDLVALGRRAALVVSNDTGPAHLLAATGAPTVVLFGPQSDPALCAPRGARVRTLSADPLAELSVAQVWTELQALAAVPPPQETTS